MSDRLHLARRVIGAATAAAMFAVLGVQVTPAHAQDDEGTVGPMVDVSSEGGAVMAAGASVTVQGASTSVKVAGADVAIRGTVERDVRAAGAQVNINATIGGNVRAGGASVEMRGRVAEDVIVGGAVVELNVGTGGDLKAGAADLNLGPGTDVGGDLKAAGANLLVRGHITGTSQIGGGLVTFNARADGPVEITGDNVVIGDQATIGGDLTITSRNDPTISESAVIAGEVIRKDLPEWWSFPAWMWAAGFAIAVAVATLIAGIVLMLFGGRIFVGAVDLVRHRPVSSFLIGLATVVVMVIIAIFLMGLVVGISAGVAVLLLLPPLFIFGHAVAAAGIAAGIFVRSQGLLGIGTALLMLVIGAVIVVLIGAIPWVGPLLAFLVLLLGVGGLARVLGARLRGATITAD